MSENPWKTLATRIVYANSWLRLREDTVVKPDGQEGIYGVVEMRPSVGIVALNDADEVALVTQWRYTLGRMSVEIRQGRLLQPGPCRRGSGNDTSRASRLSAGGPGGGAWMSYRLTARYARLSWQ
jgi:hypothetical protein